MMSSKRTALFQLGLDNLLWGFGFVAVKWGLLGFDPFVLNTYRFAIAFFAATLMFVINGAMREWFTWRDFRISLIPGLYIGIMLTFQNLGLQTTSIANSSFITTLYVIFVPLLEALISRRLVSAGHLIGVVVALFGTALLTDFVNTQTLDVGDLFTLACAVAASLHIIWLQKLADEITSVLNFNMWQFFWAGLAALIVALAMGSSFATPPLTSIAWVGLLVMAIGPTFLGFMLETHAQKVLSANATSLFLLMEAPFASVFAYLLLDEQHSLQQMVGATVIVFAAAMGVVTGRNALRKRPSESDSETSTPNAA
jgi:drug/metabolite transporter (DMT)-like permease